MTPVESIHRPVLLAETLEGLRVRPDGDYLDATLGSGGHAAAILERLGPGGRLLGIDRDPEAVARVRGRLGADARLRIRKTPFSALEEAARAEGMDRLDGVLMDLGVSSDQLQESRRGFSFQADGPLDMRMDPDTGPSAAEWLASVDETELTRVLREYGEEPDARRIARAVAGGPRPCTTSEFAALVDRVKGGRRGRHHHPATRAFQAVRMAVNRELEEIDAGLEAALRLLRPGGRLAAISFHSVEDRRVKHRLAAHAGRMESLPQGGEQWMGERPRVRRVTRKPVTASERELAENPRARSAKLRVVERMEDET